MPLQPASASPSSRPGTTGDERPTVFEARNITKVYPMGDVEV
jgi:hypothetical protein